MSTGSKENAVEDLKTLRNYILGVIAFATAVTTFFVKVLGFRQDTTLGVVLVLSALILVVGFLINRAEKRCKDEVSRVKAEIADYRKTHIDDIKYLKTMALENQRSALRTEMDNEMFRRPENHDTIIKYAYRYFIELDSDWVETEKFEAWMESEEKHGRKVHLPRELLANINYKIELDKAK